MNHQNFDAEITQDFEDAGLDTALPTTFGATVLELTVICQAIKTCSKHSVTTRIQESVDQAILEREHGNLDISKIIENSRKAESKNATYCMFKDVRGKNQISKLTTVRTPTLWPSPDQLDDSPRSLLLIPKCGIKMTSRFTHLLFPTKSPNI
jgi:hypothetical protein